MKVLLIAENWPPRVGGIERYLTGLAGELAKSHDVTVVAPKVSPLPPPTHPLQPIRKRFFWPLIKPSWLPLYIFIHRLAAQEKFDLVLCGKGLFEGLVGYYLKKKLDIPYVIFTYAMEIEEWNRHAGTRRKLARVLQGAQKVIVINEVTKKRLQEFGVSESNIHKIYPAVDEKFLEAIQKPHTPPNKGGVGGLELVPKKYSIHKPYILTVARLVPRKGIDDVIRAFAKLDQMHFKDVELVIVGDGPERGHLEKIAAQEYVRPKFLGNIPDEDLPALFASAELFALTPKKVSEDIEGFGIVYLEAGAAGIPAIGTKTGGVPEAVVGNETGLLVEPGNIDAIHGAIAQLLTDSALRQRLGDAGKKRVQDMFTWKKQSTLLEIGE